MFKVPDQAQREQALDMTRSFIVHAPAGSGKTELLVQRYLKLLAHSPSPETVIVITFARKAAQELKTRVLEALSSQEARTDIKDSHLKQTAILAAQVNQWQRKKGWDLINEPHRLRILTIDAFYTQLFETTKDKHILHASLSEQPQSLYYQAVKKLFVHLESNDVLKAAMIQLLTYLNNDLQHTETLLVQMLAQRDQWLWILEEECQDLSQFRTLLENNIKDICHAACHNTEAIFCAAHETTHWKTLLQQIFNAYHPNAKNNILEFWRFISHALLTQAGKWRHSIAKLSGTLPTVELKEQFNHFFKELTQKESCRIALVAIQKLPNIYYTQPQWEWLTSLLLILKSLVVFLDTVFQEHHQVDHIEIGLKAFHALGQEDTPEELLLQLDRTVQHILIDEFQDTSLPQIRFFRKLTEGWQLNDGRTIFLVGDPMQSIYRFRNAEARLFDVVKTIGLGGRPLIPLTLTTNFRAAPGLIHWTNQTFQKINEDLKAIYYHSNPFTLSLPSLVQPQAACNTKISVHYDWFTQSDTAQECDHVVILIKRYLQSHEENQGVNTPPHIAVLGRTRQSLLKVIRKLRRAQILHTAVEVETLSDKPAVQDLLALTRALYHLADDTAWLAILRAPWCGATLKELHALTQRALQSKPRSLIWEQLQQLDTFSFRPNTFQRLQRIKAVLEPIIENDGRVSLEQRIKQAWFNLGGPASQPNDNLGQSDTDAFFQCFHSAKITATEINITELETLLETTYATTSSIDTPVSVMTIHKAKGLEFDTVILTGMHHKVRSSIFPLILFEVTPTVTGDKILLAPIKSAASKAHDPLYQFLWEKNHLYNQAETIRLLYVACTRAKKTLHLLGTLDKNDKDEIVPPTGSFLQWLWPTLAMEQQALNEMGSTEPSQRHQQHSTNTRPLFHRMSLSSTFPKASSFDRISVISEPSSRSSQHTSSHSAVTQVVKDLLDHSVFLKLFQNNHSDLMKNYRVMIRHELMQSGMNGDSLQSSVSEIMELFYQFPKHNRLQWILKPAHQDIRVNYRFGINHSTHRSEYCIDRTFIDGQTQQRWIIYYLFSDIPADTELMLQDALSPVEYKQLFDTTQAFSKLDLQDTTTTIHIGLYWPLANTWREQSFLDLKEL